MHGRGNAYTGRSAQSLSFLMDNGQWKMDNEWVIYFLL